MFINGVAYWLRIGLRIGWARGEPGIALPTELLPRLVEQIGIEPMTDNPMSSAHQNESGQESDCGIARCAECCTTVASDGPDFHRYRRVHENPQSTARKKVLTYIALQCI